MTQPLTGRGGRVPGRACSPLANVITAPAPLAADWKDSYLQRALARACPFSRSDRARNDHRIVIGRHLVRMVWRERPGRGPVSRQRPPAGSSTAVLPSPHKDDPPGKDKGNWSYQRQKGASVLAGGCDLRSAREWLLPYGPVSASAGWRRTGRNSAPRRQRRSHRDDGCDQADQGRILRLCELPPGESDTQGQRGRYEGCNRARYRDGLLFSLRP
jgi:hypothetical protein